MLFLVITDTNLTAIKACCLKVTVIFAVWVKCLKMNYLKLEILIKNVSLCNVFMLIGGYMVIRFLKLSNISMQYTNPVLVRL